jgi:hypothetical protein
MSHTFSFFSGILIGIYLDQNYKLPKIDIIVKKSMEYLKALEK